MIVNIAQIWTKQIRTFAILWIYIETLQVIISDLKFNINKILKEKQKKMYLPLDWMNSTDRQTNFLFLIPYYYLELMSRVLEV